MIKLMNLTPEYIFIAIFFLWALILTFFFLRFYLFYIKIKQGTKEKSLIPILNELLEKETNIEKSLLSLDKKVAELDYESQFFIQKVGMLRFNPFNDTGGDQSFILSLLDERDTGVVISSLHTRTGTRWYAKKVIEGKGVDHALSIEEKDAILKAKKLSKNNEKIK